MELKKRYFGGYEKGKPKFKHEYYGCECGRGVSISFEKIKAEWKVYNVLHGKVKYKKGKCFIKVCKKDPDGKCLMIEGI